MGTSPTPAADGIGPWLVGEKGVRKVLWERTKASRRGSTIRGLKFCPLLQQYIDRDKMSATAILGLWVYRKVAELQGVEKRHCRPPEFKHSYLPGEDLPTPGPLLEPPAYLAVDPREESFIEDAVVAAVVQGAAGPPRDEAASRYFAECLRHGRARLRAAPRSPAPEPLEPLEPLGAPRTSTFQFQPKRDVGIRAGPIRHVAQSPGAAAVTLAGAGLYPFRTR